MPFKIYSKEHCPNCASAKSLLEKENHPFLVVMLSNETSATTFTREDLIGLLPAARSLPQIFKDNRYIGGYKDLVNFLKNEL